MPFESILRIRFCLLALLLFVPSPATTQPVKASANQEIETLKSEVRKLRETVDSLQATLGRQVPPVESEDVKADSAEARLEAELAAELAVTSEVRAENDGAQLRGTVSRAGASLNPKISVIGSFLGAGTTADAVEKSYDAGLTEAEFSFQSYIDPYAKADFFIAFGHEVEDPFIGPDEEAAFSGEFETELEEAYLTTLSLPFSLQLKAGKFRSAFGKINQPHPHAWDFVDVPRMYMNYLGGEGLVDRGASLNWLVPNPFGFYQQLTLEVTSGATEGSSSFEATKEPLYLLHLKNFFDLHESTTLEVGFSGLRGTNDAARNITNIAAVDMTLRWKPLRLNRYKSFEWITEALVSNRETPAGEVNSTALYSFLRYQIGKRWFLGGRYDYSEFPDNGDAHESAWSGILSFFATEFQKLELQYQHGSPADAASFDRVLLRAVFVIGAHGAHQY